MWTKMSAQLTNTAIAVGSLLSCMTLMLLLLQQLM
jgi:hypothetical protein